MAIRRVLLLIVAGGWFLAATPLAAQSYQRISGNLTIKGKGFDSTYQLVKGRFFYDRNAEKLVLHLRFPRKEVYVFHDTSYYYFVDSGGEWRFQRRAFSPIMPRMTPYAMALEGRLSDFGMDRLGFRMTKIERKDSLLISEWHPPAAFRKAIGKVRIATVRGRLFGVVYYDPEDNIRQKEFYEDYRRIGNVWFPHRLVQLQFHEGKEAVQLTTYDHVVVDEKGRRDWYDFRIPSSR